MMRFVRKLAAIRDEIDSWGMRLPTASRVREPRIRVFLDRAHEGKQDILVGILSQEEGDFVFRYDPGYVQLPGSRPIASGVHFGGLADPFVPRSPSVKPLDAPRCNPPLST
jgi:hypothetical protein